MIFGIITFSLPIFGIFACREIAVEKKPKTLYDRLPGGTMYKLRPYQEEAVQSAVRHFQKQRDPAVIVLPTGAGKSLVIAELARIAKGRVLVLAHVKELVEQNHAKYASYGLEAGIYAAGLARKD